MISIGMTAMRTWLEPKVPLYMLVEDEEGEEGDNDEYGDADETQNCDTTFHSFELPAGSSSSQLYYDTTHAFRYHDQ